MNNYKYWEQFYKTGHVADPSDFAKSLNLKNKNIVDFGCGNGRDTYYFAKNNKVTGVDMFIDEIDDGNNATIYNGTIEDFMKDNKVKFNVLYARFLLHAIDAELQHDILKWGFDNVAEVYIECRSAKGEIPDTSHNRRLINSKWILRECLWIGYDIKYFEENTGFAKYQEEDPIIIRLHLTK